MVKLPQSRFIYHTAQISFILFSFSIIFYGCEKKQNATSNYVLGTSCHIDLFEFGTTRLYNTLFGRLHEIDDRMSANKNGTDIDSVNKNAGIAPVKVNEEVIYVAKTALKYATLSNGAFDPTIGPLVKLWDINSGIPKIPKDDDIQSVLALVNWKDLIINETAGTLFLQRKGMSLDFGAIAKGYAADELVEILIHNNIPRAIIDLGGNIYAFGEKANSNPWRIGIQAPTGIRGENIGLVEGKNKAFVTSGIYERFITLGDKQYHHILSTQTGYPIDNDLSSVTIIAPSAMDADALSTTVFALGYQDGCILINSLTGIQAIFVFSSGVIHQAGMGDTVFTLNDMNYTLMK